MDKIRPSHPAKVNFKNIRRYIQGWLRYLKYGFEKWYNRNKKEDDKQVSFLPDEYKEQYEWRLTVMNPTCLSNGQCVICGCETPQLQMSGEACEGKCYPDMMPKEEWEAYKKANNIKL